LIIRTKPAGLLKLLCSPMNAQSTPFCSFMCLYFNVIGFENVIKLLSKSHWIFTFLWIDNDFLYVSMFFLIPKMNGLLVLRTISSGIFWSKSSLNCIIWLFWPYIYFNCWYFELLSYKVLRLELVSDWRFIKESLLE